VGHATVTATLSAIRTPGIKPKKEITMRKLLRRILFWIAPELAAPEIGRIKTEFENLDNLRPHVSALQQRLNALAPILEQWNDYHVHVRLDSVEKAFGADIKALRADTDALKEHRTRHDAKIQTFEHIFKIMGRM